MRTPTNGRGLSVSPRSRYFTPSPEARCSTLLISSVQDDVMVEIFFDGIKDSIGMSIESSILTELKSKQLVSEWGRIVTGLIHPQVIGMQTVHT